MTGPPHIKIKVRVFGFFYTPGDLFVEASSAFYSFEMSNQACIRSMIVRASLHDDICAFWH